MFSFHLEEIELSAGLYVVATPIGNLKDITLRALEVLGNCQLVAAEDTRRVRKLLNHFEIKVKVISYREQNSRKAEPQIREAIEAGEAVALVSDAGMPCISDPGSQLVAMCNENGLPVQVIPGASAVATAMARSGIISDSFYFIGFPPPKSGKRCRLFQSLAEVQAPLVMYEAPHRVVATIRDMKQVFGSRKLWAMREMTKIHEEMLAGSLDDVLEKLQSKETIKGEFTLILGQSEASGQTDLSDEELKDYYQSLISKGLLPNDALKLLASETGRKRQELYKLLRN